VAIHNGVLRTGIQFSPYKVASEHCEAGRFVLHYRILLPVSESLFRNLRTMSTPLDPVPGDKVIGVASTDSLSSEEHGGLPDSQIRKQARRKVDKRLLIWYAFVYLIMRIHVSNITNTAIINLEQGTGIKKQLGNLTSSQWAWALSIFYYPYMFLEPVATLALKKFSPSVWMSRIMITWVCEFGVSGLKCADVGNRVSSQCVRGLPRIMLGSWLADSSWEPLRLASILVFCKFTQRTWKERSGEWMGLTHVTRYHLSFWYPTNKLPLRIVS
jgi:hypothetical protein